MHQQISWPILGLDLPIRILADFFLRAAAHSIHEHFCSFFLNEKLTCNKVLIKLIETQEYLLHQSH